MSIMQQSSKSQDFANSKSAPFESMLLASGEQPSLGSIWPASGQAGKSNRSSNER